MGVIMKQDEGVKKMIIALFTLIIAISIAFAPPLPGLNDKSMKMIGIIILAVVYWATECIPMPITGLMIILLLVILGVLPFSKAYSYVADKVIALMLAGEVLSVVLAKHGVDRYISLKILGITGERAERVILGTMLSTALISMWIPNTAAAAIMAPIAVGVLSLFGAEKGKSNLGKAMMIGVAYAASTGGLGTPVGTPPNPITISYVEKSSGIKIGFTTWMMWGVPLALILTLIAWIILIMIYRPEIKNIGESRRIIEMELAKIGGLSGERFKAFLFFLIAASLWISDPVSSRFVPDWTYVVSVLMIIAVALPRVGVLTWSDISKGVDWGILFLFGGGLALGGGLIESGLASTISNIVSKYLSGYSPIVMILGIGLIASLSIVAFCSITATASFSVPVAVAVAKGLNMHPAVAAIAAGIASTFAFLLPANTPPNAIAYSYGYFKNYEMAKVGLLLIFVSLLVSLVFSAYVVPYVLGISVIYTSP